MDKRTLLWLLMPLLAALFSACAAPAAAPPTPTVPPEWERPGWELVWHDEFDGETLDPSSWIFDLGAGGWGNKELQSYTDRPENLRLVNGLLIIEARQEEYRASDYTSARIKTQGMGGWAYGRIEARIQVPSGQGIWPAFWMLGADFPTAGWPACGEIDIMEHVGEPGIIYGTLHGPGYSGGDGVGTSYRLPGGSVTDGFHTYAIEWRPGEVAWYVDDVMFNRVTADMVPGDWVYDHPFFIILNVAVGGEWPGYPDETTVFPQQMRVDYVRVYRDPDLDLSALASGEIHVDDIQLDLAPDGDTWAASASVRVVDQDGNPVPDVTVEASWLGTIAGADLAAVTGPDGMAGPFTARQGPGSKEITFCVYRLIHPLLDYEKDANEFTCVVAAPQGEP